MSGERELSRLLQGLAPRLYSERYTFEETDDGALATDVFALIREEEGITVIRPDPSGRWARVSLGVHSSLEAVGLTAALSAALTAAGISTNIIAGLRHDHLFVPWDERERALACLESLSS